MNETIRVAFGLIGGLALFLFGMNMMSDSLQKVAGEKMKKVLAMLTRNPLLGVISGALVTAVLQSSSATTVMAIGFVSAGLISLPQAISVIFGANIGTTMTAQIIAFNISDYIYPIIFIGFIIQFVAKSEKLKYIGQAVLAFGLLFLGIETMGNVMKPLADSPFFVNLIAQVSDVPILGVLVGMCMTLVVQSSSATIAVLQNFASQPGPDGVSSVLGLAGAIPVLLGDNIGTTITAILASIGQSRDAKRTALAHCLFNVSGTCLFIWFIKPYARLIQYISPHGDEIAVISRQIANAHTCFNLTMTLIWLPLLWLMVKIVMKILPERDYERKPITTLDDNLLHQPVSALHLVFEEIIACSDRVNDMLVSLRGIRLKTLKDTLQVVHSEAQEIAVQGDAISEYLAKMFSKGVLTDTQASDTTGLMLVVNDIDRISGLCGQISDNMAKANQGKSGYSKEAIKEISKLFDVLSGLYEAVHRSIVMGNVTAMQKSMDDKEELVRLDDKIRAAHMKRVGKGLCDASLTISLNELLHDVERIGNTCLDLMEMASQEINFSKFLIDKKKSAGGPPAISGQRPKLQA